MSNFFNIYVPHLAVHILIFELFTIFKMRLISEHSTQNIKFESQCFFCYYSAYKRAFLARKHRRRFYFTLINLRLFTYTMREDNAVCAIITMQLPRFPDSPRLRGKMSMLIADRFVNSPCRPPRSLCLTASGLSVSLPPSRTTFNYPSMHRAIVDVANIKDLAPTMYGTRCPRSLARDSTSAIDSVIVDSTR